ncbi:MAG: hypothetical protein LBV37_02590 [Mycoplasmataceae bacterium]|jgi:hypothetical protein|nr:hypothetical protein [Mycoplasmataceae bacterium]
MDHIYENKIGLITIEEDLLKLTIQKIGERFTYFKLVNVEISQDSTKHFYFALDYSGVIHPTFVEDVSELLAQLKKMIERNLKIYDSVISVHIGA